MCKCDTLFFIMPSQRKRIGFLPSEDIHEIIDKISKVNKFSQSKVTGILVEEALKSRGLVNSSFIKTNNLANSRFNDSRINNSLSSIIEPSDNSKSSSMNKENLNDELKMINNFIEYKIFKRVMNKNKNILDI